MGWKGILRRLHIKFWTKRFINRRFGKLMIWFFDNLKCINWNDNWKCLTHAKPYKKTIMKLFTVVATFPFFPLLDPPDPPDPSFDLGVSCKDYKGGRTFNDLSTFAKGLGPQCGPANPEPWLVFGRKTKLGTCFVGCFCWDMGDDPESIVGKMLNDLQIDFCIQKLTLTNKKTATRRQGSNQHQALIEIPKDLCDAEKKKMLDEFMALDSSKRDTMIKVQNVITPTLVEFGFLRIFVKRQKSKSHFQPWNFWKILWFGESHPFMADVFFCWDLDVWPGEGSRDWEVGVKLQDFCWWAPETIQWSQWKEGQGFRGGFAGFEIWNLEEFGKWQLK